MTSSSSPPRKTVNAAIKKYQKNGASLSVAILPDEDGNTEFEYVLIEGDPEALRFLSEILAAMADDESDDGYQIHPKGAGSSYFNPSSPLGLYIHRRDGRK